MISLYRWMLVGMLVMVASLVPVARAQTEATLQVADNATLGPILVDGEGLTLYHFTRDEPGVSNCTGECLANWPPLLAAEGAVQADAGVTGQLGTIARDDGSQQVTYNDMPLYYFANDSAPGDVNGQNVREVWFAVHPDAPGVTVNDQAIENDTVTIERVVAAEPGWLVVHAEANGRPGPILGQTAVAPGENTDVAVQVSTAGATETLYAMLHSDRGEMGRFEFPDGADIPVTVDGQVVTPPFSVTGGLPQQSAAAAPAPTAAPAPAPDAPATLPATNGGTSSALLVLLVVAIMAIAGGVGVLIWRRAR